MSSQSIILKDHHVIHVSVFVAPLFGGLTWVTGAVGCSEPHALR